MKRTKRAASSAGGDAPTGRETSSAEASAGSQLESGRALDTGRSLKTSRGVTGRTLAFKSTLVSTITIALLLGVFGFVVYSTSQRALNREIDTLGVDLARTLAAPDVDWWQQGHGSLREAIDMITQAWPQYDRLLPEKYRIRVLSESESEAPTEGDAPASPEIRAQTDAFRDALEATLRANRSRLDALTRFSNDGESLPSLIVDAFIKYENRPESVIRANREAPSFRPHTKRRFVFEHDGRSIVTDAEIIEGEFPGLGRARSYSVPIRDDAGNVTHRAFVFLSERGIQARLGSLLSQILLLTLGFIAIGAVVTFVITRQMTAPLGDLVNDIEIVSGGKLTHRTIARSSDEIGLLARTFDRMVRSLHEAETERTAHQALRHEVAVATEVQSKLLPEALPVVPGYELDVLRVTTGDIGGAYYDVIDLPDGRLGLVIAEGSGQGVPAAMTVVMARTLLRSEGERTSDPKEILQRANAALSRDIRKGMYVSILLAVLDPKERVIRVCGAGRAAFQHFHATDGNVETLVPDGIALGFDRGPVFDRSLRVNEVSLEEGDRLVLHTGSPVRVHNAAGDELGEATWEEVVRRAAPRATRDFIAAVGGALDKYRAGTTIEEDVIVVTLRVGPRNSIE